MDPSITLSAKGTALPPPPLPENLDKAFDVARVHEIMSEFEVVEDQHDQLEDEGYANAPAAGADRARVDALIERIELIDRQRAWINVVRELCRTETASMKQFEILAHIEAASASQPHAPDEVKLKMACERIRQQKNRRFSWRGLSAKWGGSGSVSALKARVAGAEQAAAKSTRSSSCSSTALTTATKTKKTRTTTVDVEDEDDEDDDDDDDAGATPCYYRFKHPSICPSMEDERYMSRTGEIIVQQFDVSDRDQSGLWVWQCAELMAGYLCSDEALNFTSADSCIELGCGAGLISLTLARLGVGTVVATDADRTATKLCADNAHCNGVEGAVTTLELKWGDDAAARRAVEAAAPRAHGRLLVIGTDVLYNSSEHDALEQTIRSLITSYAAVGGKHVEVMLGWTARSSGDAAFFKRLKDLSYDGRVHIVWAGPLRGALFMEDVQADGLLQRGQVGGAAGLHRFAKLTCRCEVPEVHASATLPRAGKSDDWS